MMYDRGAFSGFMRLSDEYRCGVDGCDVTSSAYPVVANSKDSANTLAASVLIAAAARTVVDPGATVYRGATDPKPLAMDKTPKKEPRILPAAQSLSQTDRVSAPRWDSPLLHLNDRR
jgi:hypothetical protein